jgi:hypothetical protein
MDFLFEMMLRMILSILIGLASIVIFKIRTYVASGMIRTKNCSCNFINQELLYL